MILKNYLAILAFLFVLILFKACRQEGITNDLTSSDPNISSTDRKVFSKLPSSETGIVFRNDIVENKNLNYLKYLYAYNGAGIAIGDINNDGLEDIFFSSNMGQPSLYLNKGDLRFEDITVRSGILSNNGWQTGVSMIDINMDGLLDIYISRSGPNYMPKANLLYINQGNLKFVEQAAAYNLAYNSNTTQTVFFDYDLDGDLDVYMVNHPLDFPKRYSDQFENLDAALQTSDRLLENLGNGKFSDATIKSGILNRSFGLNASVADLNNDGFPDIYVSSDFGEPDHLYINQGDGSFKDEIQSSTGHISQYAMGTDIADINNDGMMDIMVADMSPADNFRSKMMMGAMQEDKFWNSVNAGNHYQYMYNTLQLNRGNTLFSEIAMMAGVARTDWSWSPLIADFDNDGMQDIFISNGIKRDVLDNDMRFRVAAKGNAQPGANVSINLFDVLELYPVQKLRNYIFKNEGEYRFENKAEDWGMQEKSFSNGAAYSDLDNDGDLDLVINNVDEEAFVYRNTTTDNAAAKFLRIQLNGKAQNPKGIGAKVEIETKDSKQFRELSPVRGYLSSSSYTLLFGLGDTEKIDKLKVTWPSGATELQTDLVVNNTILLDEKNAQIKASEKESVSTNFRLINNSLADFKHAEQGYNDMLKESLIPHKLSKNGPCISKGDVNGDGLEDIFVGNGAGFSSALYLQTGSGDFKKQNTSVFADAAKHEDLSSTFFDLDTDGDLDLYVASGSNEALLGSDVYQDQLYINDGNGNFRKATDEIPEFKISSAVVKSGDFDGDGDMDLFVGGKSIPGNYGVPASSFILENREGNLGLMQGEKVRILNNLGMVNDAAWIDLNGDEKLDLIIAGEWMPITILIWTSNGYINKTKDYGLDKTNGWWNAIAAHDLDADGDVDFVLGNLGKNYKFKASESEPLELYVNDFDSNNQNDIVLAYYEHGGLYPVRGRNCTMEQMPIIKTQFPNYTTFAKSNLVGIYGESLKNSIHHKAYLFESVILENQGSTFDIKSLPAEAQLSAIKSIQLEDVDSDGKDDLILAGNQLHSEAETPRGDASYGIVLRQTDGLKFKTLHSMSTNLVLKGEVHAMETFSLKNGKRLLVAGINGEKLRIFEIGASK